MNKWKTKLVLDVIGDADTEEDAMNKLAFMNISCEDAELRGTRVGGSLNLIEEDN